MWSRGHILHTMDDVTVEMKAGDTVSIPKGVYHNGNEHRRYQGGARHQLRLGVAGSHRRIAVHDDRRRVRSLSGRLPGPSGIFLFPGALLLAFLLAWPAPGRPEPESATKEPVDPGEISLFDGKSLDGWSGDSRYWSVIDGAITGRTDIPLEENTYLIREGTFSDFEARLKYRFLTEIGNSGLQYRGRGIEGKPFVVRGYQANIVTTHADRTFAMLWEDEARELLALYRRNSRNFCLPRTHQQGKPSSEGLPAW